jgi:hypothetical protein
MKLPLGKQVMMRWTRDKEMPIQKVYWDHDLLGIHRVMEKEPLK